MLPNLHRAHLGVADQPHIGEAPLLSGRVVSTRARTASEDINPNLPPMGLRFRMKADYDCSGLSQEVQVICAALKKYGMFVADNGGNWYISGAPDERWNDDSLADLKEITGDALEVVDTGEVLISD